MPRRGRVIEKELDRIAALDQREVRLNARGLNYGVVITLAFLAACVYLIATGHGVEGTVLGVIFISWPGRGDRLSAAGADLSWSA